ncbi:type I restriction endonuclease subunit R, partial [Phocaeicola vulgatus]|nr:type I restriction endonuclease subunit R [Phocaeicola vulgatus]
YAPNFISIEKTDIPQPALAWFICGKTAPIESTLDFTFWQDNPETQKGYILVHYETSPVSSITCLWIAETDGVIEPF